MTPTLATMNATIGEGTMSNLKSMLWLSLCLGLAVGCGDAENKSDWDEEWVEDCGDGFARADDGNCYPYQDSDTGNSSELPGGNGSDLDDPSDDGGIDADGGDGGIGDDDGDDGFGDDDGTTDDGVDGSDVDGGDDGASPPDDAPPPDEGPADDGPADDGPADGGPIDEGPTDEGPSEGDDLGDPSGESCTTDDDCELSDCPSGSIGCVCLADAGFCVPSCSSDADCPSEVPFCEESLGVCGPDDL